MSALRTLLREENVVEAAEEHWRWIWKEIKYVPIFQLGERILLELPSAATTESAFRGVVVGALTNLY